MSGWFLFWFLWCGEKDKLGSRFRLLATVATLQVLGGIRNNINPYIDIWSLIRVARISIDNISHLKGCLQVD